MAGVIVHEWISPAGGSENVLEAMSHIYPDADIQCLWNDSTGRFDESRVRETWLARTPLRRSKALALPLMPATWRRLSDRDYEWALISSHLFAHHARFQPGSAGIRRHVYVHTPARYIWNPELDVRGNGLATRAAAAALKPLDRRVAREPGGSFAANSEFVRRRIGDAWGVDARVIYPPVDVDRIQRVTSWRDELGEADAAIFDALPETFILGASRLIPYKRLDLVIRAGETSGTPVVIAGDGPELPALRQLAETASVPVHFVVAPSGPLLYALFQATMLYVFPAVEDFGIMPVEAMAAGAPVLAQAVGGAAESVVEGVTGALVTFDDDDAVREGIALALTTTRDSRLARAREFATARFDDEIRGWVGA